MTSAQLASRGTGHAELTDESPDGSRYRVSPAVPGIPALMPADQTYRHKCREIVREVDACGRG